MTTVISGIITYVLYSGVIGLSGYNLYKYYKHKKKDINRTVNGLIMELSLLQIVMSLLFMTLQSDWLFMDYNDLLDSETTVAWLLFDLLNGMVHLSMALIIKYYYEHKPEQYDKELSKAMKVIEQRLLLHGIETDTGLRLIPCTEYQEEPCVGECDNATCTVECKEYCRFNKDVVSTCKMVSNDLTNDLKQMKDIINSIRNEGV